MIQFKDEKGNVLYSEKFPEKKWEHKKVLDLAKYAKGVYFVQVDSQRAQQVQRIELN
jgi:hypothetical protein